MRVKFDLSVLYVEDEEMIRTTTGGYFQRRFTNVYFAANGEEGLLKYKKFAPDIIIADILHPAIPQREKKVSVIRTWSGYALMAN